LFYREKPLNIESEIFTVQSSFVTSVRLLFPCGIRHVRAAGSFVGGPEAGGARPDGGEAGACGGTQGVIGRRTPEAG
jgi:hypothetical protein